VLNLRYVLEQPHRRLMGQAVDQRHRDESILSRERSTLGCPPSRPRRFGASTVARPRSCERRWKAFALLPSVMS
jgi:hypothetical protein